MDKVKLTIVFYSMTGTNYQLAKWAEEAAIEAGAEVRLRKVKELAPIEVIEATPPWKANYDAMADIPEATLDDLAWADAFIFSTPTRYGNMAAQMRQFLDTTGPIWAKGMLANKPVTAMTSASNTHGGQETTLLSLYNTMYHWGAYVIPPGYTDGSVSKAGGNPYGTSMTVGQEKIEENVKPAVFHQTKRVLDVAKKLK